MLAPQAKLAKYMLPPETQRPAGLPVKVKSAQSVCPFPRPSVSPCGPMPLDQGAQSPCTPRIGLDHGLGALDDIEHLQVIVGWLPMLIEGAYSFGGEALSPCCSVVLVMGSENTTVAPWELHARKLILLARSWAVSKGPHNFSH